MREEVIETQPSEQQREHDIRYNVSKATTILRDKLYKAFEDAEDLVQDPV